MLRKQSVILYLASACDYNAFKIMEIRIIALYRWHNSVVSYIDHKVIIVCLLFYIKLHHKTGNIGLEILANVLCYNFVSHFSDYSLVFLIEVRLIIYKQYTSNCYWNNNRQWKSDTAWLRISTGCRCGNKSLVRFRYHVNCVLLHDTVITSENKARVHLQKWQDQTHFNLVGVGVGV